MYSQLHTLIISKTSHVIGNSATGRRYRGDLLQVGYPAFAVHNGSARSDCSCGHHSQNTENRLLIGVAGYVSHISVFMDSYWRIHRPAGCGKSTIAFPLTNRINDILITRSAASCEKAISAVCVSLDGWHYTRAQLDQMDDPVKAHWWRVSDYNLDNVPKAHPFE